jgi:hypothetical protein
MVEPANFGPRHDPSGAGRIDGASLGRVLAEREVRSRVRVVRDVRSKHAAEMSLIEDDDVVQTLATDGPDDAFDVGIGVSSRLHRLRAVRHKPSGLPIPFIPCVAGRFR